MSGYRLIHREQVLGQDTAVWSLVSTPLICRRASSAAATAGSSSSSEALSWRVWAACSDGLIRTYLVKEVSLAQKESSLTASALDFGEQPTHILKPSSSSSAETSSSSVALGCACLSILRNYAGEDDAAGNVIVAGMDISGILRLWELDENLDQSSSDDQQHDVAPLVELTVPQATGTAIALAPPRTIMPHLKCLLVAVALLDGSVSLISTGIAVPTTTTTAADAQQVPAAGTVVESWSTGSALACRLVFRPNMAQLAVSRQDGTVDLIPMSSSSSTAPTPEEGGKQRLHRLSHLTAAPARALTFTTDGALLIAGNDHGRIIIWDVTRPNGVPAIVNHQVQATTGTSAWLWQFAAVDGRRFLSLATDRTIRVWQVDQIHHQPLHSFTSSDDIRLWSISRPALGSKTNPHPPRLVAGSENGWLQVYSLVEKV